MPTRRLRHFVTALICGLVPLIPAAPVHASSPATAASPRLSAPPESAVLTKFRDNGPPVMQRAAAFEATATARTFADASAGHAQVKQVAVSNTRLFREVFGFAFASSLGDRTIGYPSWNFGLLSTVAYFGIHVDWTGGFSAGSGLTTWNDPNGPVPGFIQTAHASGTKVVLTIELFDSTNGTPNMCSALERTDVTIRSTVAEINAKGIDGVNIDYESNNTTCHDPGFPAQSSQSLFTAFVASMRAALPPGSYLSVDTYSGAAGYRDATGAYLGFFDIGALNNYVDSFFVMAYDMEYANWDQPPLSCPSFCLGPTAPLSTYAFNDSTASAEYRAVVPASKVIMGIPYYGRKECVAVPDPNQIPPNAMGSSVGADGYLDASTEEGYPGNTLYVHHRETRDPYSATRWDTFSSVSFGCNRLMYWDDATALGNKYNLIIKDGLRGPGIFALNYGGGAPELWDLINLKFGQCSEAAITADKTSPQIPGTSVTFTGNALCAGTGEFRFWQPPGASAPVRTYSPATTWSWDTTGKPLGTYIVQVDARNHLAAADVDTSAQMSFRLALCVTPTITADKVSPQLPGTTITFTATVTCQGTTTPEYRFVMLPPGGTWSMVQDYGSASTFKWDTTHLAYGDYKIGVHVRTAGTTVVSESVQSMSFGLRSCISAALSADKASPQPTGTQVVLSGAATCDGAAQYRFMIQPPGGSWAVLRDFGSSAYTWLGGGPGGNFNLEVDSKSVLAPASSLSSAQLAYQLTSCTAITLATNLASPLIPGPTVTVSGSATCPATAQYRFWVHKPDGWVGVVQDYGATNTYSWNTAGLPYGAYGLRVDARDVGGTSSYEATQSVAFQLTPPICTTLSISAAPASTAPAGTSITVTASTTCPDANPQFQFVALWAGTSYWITQQAYSTNNTWTWNSTGARGGVERFGVWVKDVRSPYAYDQLASIPFTVTNQACTALSLSTWPASPQPSGTWITVTAGATCPNPQFKFVALWAGTSSWITQQPYSASSTWTWNSAGAPAGIERFGVWVRDASSLNAAFDQLASIPDTVTVTPCTSITASAAPPSPSAAGTTLTITGAAVGCANPLYEFWMLAPGSSTWTLVAPYWPGASFTWDTTGKPAGNYRFAVWVRDFSSPGTGRNGQGTFDAFTPFNYTLN